MTNTLDAELEAFDVAQQIKANYSGMASIDTADERECAFIFASVELALTDHGTAVRIAELMKLPEVRDAVCPRPEDEE